MPARSRLELTSTCRLLAGGGAHTCAQASFAPFLAHAACMRRSGLHSSDGKLTGATRVVIWLCGSRGPRAHTHAGIYTHTTAKTREMRKLGDNGSLPRPVEGVLSCPRACFACLVFWNLRENLSGSTIPADFYKGAHLFTGKNPILFAIFSTNDGVCTNRG